VLCIFMRESTEYFLIIRPILVLLSSSFLSQFDGYICIFTDGSKSGEAVGSAAIVASRVCKKRLPNNSSIFSVEAREMLLVLDVILRSTGS